jgi:hypothetical protein
MVGPGDRRRGPDRQMAAKARKIEQQNCILAERDLAGIRYKRSHGYEAYEANSLDRRTRDLEKIRNISCR